MSRYTLSLIILIFCISTFAFPVDPKWRDDQITMTPPNPSTGNPVTFSCLFKQGRGPLESLLVVAKIDNVRVWSHRYRDLEDQQQFVISFSWIATPGNHNLRMIIDPNNAVDDQNRVNNVRIKRFTVIPSGPAAPEIPREPEGNLQTLTSTLKEPIRTLTSQFVPGPNESPCQNDEHGTIDLSVSNFRLSNTNNIEIKRYSFTINNHGTKCLLSFRWSLVDSFNQVVYTGVSQSKTLNKFVIRANDDLPLSRQVSKGDFARLDNCETVSLVLNDDAERTVESVAKLKPCSRVRIIVDPLSEITEMNEANNQSMEKIIRW